MRRLSYEIPSRQHTYSILRILFAFCFTLDASVSSVQRHDNNFLNVDHRRNSITEPT